MGEEQRATGTSWWKVFLIGLGLYVVGLVALVLTNNPTLFPTVVLIGNFLVPVTYVVFFQDHDDLERVGWKATGVSFVYGGLIGVLAAAILEPLIIQQVNIVTIFLVGFIEEGVGCRSPGRGAARDLRSRCESVSARTLIWPTWPNWR